ncbi:hypothetical protein WJX72_004380 [[Myrmecia] bisecta]|uniref:Uncharacterized protein n=1 Tax=[Myrmecia] bisecta TaxID=41462 RepID=A0AAW1PN92_9CHLO
MPISLFNYSRPEVCFPTRAGLGLEAPVTWPSPWKAEAARLGDSQGKSHPQRSCWGRRGRHLQAPVIMAQLAIIMLITFYLAYTSSSMFEGLALNGDAGSRGPTGVDTLVIYIFSPTDAEYERNMRFFIQQGIGADDHCHYIFVVQQTDKHLEQELPKLPPHAWYIFHENRCFDWGTIGWLFRTGKIDTAAYKYFVLMNSSVRGPFTPTYYKGSHWTRIFTDRITDEVKLVGPTISCEGAPKPHDPQNTWRQNPHVQSYVAATDQKGLEVMLSHGQIFSCYDSLHDTIYYSELGASLAILDAGFNIDSLMIRYQGIDWRDRRHWKCNQGFSPYAEHHYDGLSMDPLEVVFVKVKSYLLDLKWTGSTKAAKYDRWVTARTVGMREESDVVANEWVDHADQYRLPKMLSLQTIGGGCFDSQYYLEKNYDLAGFPMSVLFTHFAYNGQFEGRPFRFIPHCHMDYERAVWKLTNGKLGVMETG